MRAARLSKSQSDSKRTVWEIIEDKKKILEAGPEELKFVETPEELRAALEIENPAPKDMTYVSIHRKYVQVHKLPEVLPSITNKNRLSELAQSQENKIIRLGFEAFKKAFKWDCAICGNSYAVVNDSILVKSSGSRCQMRYDPKLVARKRKGYKGTSKKPGKPGKLFCVKATDSRSIYYAILQDVAYRVSPYLITNGSLSFSSREDNETEFLNLINTVSELWPEKKIWREHYYWKDFLKNVAPVIQYRIDHRKALGVFEEKRKLEEEEKVDKTIVPSGKKAKITVFSLKEKEMETDDKCLDWCELHIKIVVGKEQKTFHEISKKREDDYHFEGMIDVWKKPINFLIQKLGIKKTDTFSWGVVVKDNRNIANELSESCNEHGEWLIWRNPELTCVGLESIKHKKHVKRRKKLKDYYEFLKEECEQVLKHKFTKPEIKPKKGVKKNGK